MTRLMLNPKKKSEDFNIFLELLSTWLTNIMAGDLSARLNLDKESPYYLVSNNINAVSDMLEKQVSKNNEQIERFSKYKEEKNIEINKLAIVEERIKFASELHDSLAQTLATLKLQVRVLDESMHQSNEKSMWSELEKLEKSIERANTEIRKLIKHFRSGSSEENNFFNSINNVVNDFKNDFPSAKMFYQNNISDININNEQELNIVRIIQEALTNVKKHSKASTVRLFLTSENADKYLIIIEDDGIGIAKSCFMGHDEEPSDDHFGINIMRDRAKKIDGDLKIESEPGEGVRIILRFSKQLENS